jgi:hypothetical protein
MKSLLESTNTDNLEVAFKKYLKPVMEGAAPVVKKQIVESHTEVTGDRAATADQKEHSNNIVEIRRLAGLASN